MRSALPITRPAAESLIKLFNKRVKGFTQSCDVAPTVTDWLGLGVHPLHQGKSLLPLANTR